MRVLILACFCFLCCSERKSESVLIIKNDMNVEFDSVIVTIDTKLKFFQLGPLKKQSQKFSTVNLQRTHNDHAFFLTAFVRDSIVCMGTFGYSTHGNFEDKYTLTLYGNFQYKEESE